VPLKFLRVPLDCVLRARKVRTWLPDRSLISVRSYWGPILRIWDLTHFDEHCGKEGSSTRQNTCEYHVGDPFGIVSDQPTILLAKSQRGSQYVVQFRDDRREVGYMLYFCTGAGTHNFQIASQGLQYRVKKRVLDHIRPRFTLQNFQCSIDMIFAF